jgi:hypothetical protein
VLSRWISAPARFRAHVIKARPADRRDTTPLRISTTDSAPARQPDANRPRRCFHRTAGAFVTSSHVLPGGFYRLYVSDASRRQPSIRLESLIFGGPANRATAKERQPVGNVCRGSGISGTCRDYPVESYLAPSVRSTQSLEAYAPICGASQRALFPRPRNGKCFLDTRIVLSSPVSVNP